MLLFILGQPPDQIWRKQSMAKAYQEINMKVDELEQKIQKIELDNLLIDFQNQQIDRENAQIEQENRQADQDNKALREAAVKNIPASRNSHSAVRFP